MTRLDKFRLLSDHAHYSRLIQRLKQSDIKMIEQFNAAHEQLDIENFSFILNRFFLSKEKPKNWGLILEILMTSNSNRKGMT